MPVKKSLNGNKKRTMERPRVTRDDIARRAYDKFVARGRQPGRELEDWLAAEQELLAEPAREKRGKILAR